MTRDIKEDADEERRTMGNKSDGMDNVFLGNDRQEKGSTTQRRSSRLVSLPATTLL